MVITASAGLRGPKRVELKSIVDSACRLTQQQGFQARLLPWRLLVFFQSL